MAHRGRPAAAAPADGPATEAIRLRQHQEWLRQHLDVLHSGLFRELTGLRFRLAWAPTGRQPWSAGDLPTASPVCHRLAAGQSQASVRCLRCGVRRLALTLRAGQKGHAFRCPGGVRNAWFPIAIRGLVIGIAFIQAPEGNGERPAGVRGKRGPRSGGAAACGRLQPMHQSAFNRAAKLLRLVVVHAAASALAEVNAADLVAVRHQGLVARTEQTRWQARLAPPPDPCRATPATGRQPGHGPPAIRTLVAYLRDHCAEPLTLQSCAEMLELCPAYLSGLFARTVGKPFKATLIGFRMEKAEELLTLPNLKLAEVAARAGYASENRFRLAFKKAHGICPSAWREAVRQGPDSPT